MKSILELSFEILHHFGFYLGIYQTTDGMTILDECSDEGRWDGLVLRRWWYEDGIHFGYHTCDEGVGQGLQPLVLKVRRVPHPLEDYVDVVLDTIVRRQADGSPHPHVGKVLETSRNPRHP